MKYVFFLFCIIVLQCCNQPSSKENLTKQIAEANGVENFKNVQMLEFIFNVQHDTAAASSRHWQWFLKLMK